MLDQAEADQYTDADLLPHFVDVARRARELPTPDEISRLREAQAELQRMKATPAPDAPAPAPEPEPTPAPSGWGAPKWDPAWNNHIRLDNGRYVPRDEYSNPQIAQYANEFHQFTRENLPNLMQSPFDAVRKDGLEDWLAKREQKLREEIHREVITDLQNRSAQQAQDDFLEQNTGSLFKTNPLTGEQEQTELGISYSNHYAQKMQEFNILRDQGIEIPEDKAQRLAHFYAQSNITHEAAQAKLGETPPPTADDTAAPSEPPAPTMTSTRAARQSSFMDRAEADTRTNRVPDVSDRRSVVAKAIEDTINSDNDLDAVFDAEIVKQSNGSIRPSSLQ